MRLLRNPHVGVALLAALASSALWTLHRKGIGDVQCSSVSLPEGDAIGLEILVDSQEFMARLEGDLGRAAEDIAIQTMSFEGDAAGSRLAAALASSPAPVKQMLVDSYSRFVISDKFRFFPKYWGDDELRKEAQATRRALADLGARGVSVKLTNPMDPLLMRFLARNHKKAIVIDRRVAYVGGINFCDHNFAWHDMMVRLESKDVARFLWEDFQATWRGVNWCAQRDFGSVWLAALDGRRNGLGLARVVEAMEGARQRIFIESGYLTFPFFRWLRAARARGVDVVLLTPEENNKPIVKEYLLWEATRAGFEIRLFPGRMSHLKAMVIDDATLIAGSSNFDYISHTVQQELVIMVTDRDAVGQFVRRVLEPDLRESALFTERVSARAGWPRFLAMKTLGMAMTGMSRALDGLLGVPKPEWASAWTGEASGESPLREQAERRSGGTF